MEVIVAQVFDLYSVILVSFTRETINLPLKKHCMVAQVTVNKTKTRLIFSCGKRMFGCASAVDPTIDVAI